MLHLNSVSKKEPFGIFYSTRSDLHNSGYPACSTQGEFSLKVHKISVLLFQGWLKERILTLRSC